VTADFCLLLFNIISKKLEKGDINLEMALDKISVNKINEYYDVSINESLLTSRTMHRYEEICQAYRLRHQIFAEALHWVPTCTSRLETDDYDIHAQHFGVFDKDELLCYLRLITPGKPFMIEQEFNSLISKDHIIRKMDDTGEVSRLCISPHVRTNRVPIGTYIHSISIILFKSLYHWCKINGIRYLYIVVAHKVLRMLNIIGVPCKPVGTQKVMPDGIIALAAIIDCRDIEIKNAIRKPTAFQWLSQIQSNPMKLPPPVREAYLPPQVSA